MNLDPLGEADLAAGDLGDNIEIQHRRFAASLRTRVGGTALDEEGQARALSYRAPRLCHGRCFDMAFTLLLPHEPAANLSTRPIHIIVGLLTADKLNGKSASRDIVQPVVD
jgi:hypothetical protein